MQPGFAMLSAFGRKTDVVCTYPMRMRSANAVPHSERLSPRMGITLSRTPFNAMLRTRYPYEEGFFSHANTRLAPENLATGSVKYPIPANMSTTVSPLQSSLPILLLSTRFPEANMMQDGSQL